MCQRCTALFSTLEVVTFTEPLEVESGVTCGLGVVSGGGGADQCPDLGRLIAHESVTDGGAVSCYTLPCFSLSMWWHNFSAGPSFRPMYFMIISLRSSIRAFPSISCGAMTLIKETDPDLILYSVNEKKTDQHTLLTVSIACT